MINVLTLFSKKMIHDNRGKSCKFAAKKMGNIDIDELYLSYSKKNVIRGIHFQDEPYAQRKTVSVISGRITDVIIDLRPDSSTFLSIDVFDISEESDFLILIPKGCGHGFLALAEENIVLYGIEGQYKKESDSGILWSSIDYDWGIEKPILSNRDQGFITLEKYLLERNYKHERNL